MAIQDNDIRLIIGKFNKSSYVPTIILNEEETNLINKYNGDISKLKEDKSFMSLSAMSQQWVATSMTTGCFSCIVTPMSSNILGGVWQFFSDILFPGRNLAKICKEAQIYIQTASEEYEEYEVLHEQILDDIQSQIDIINKKKPIMKDYILEKVCKKLQLLGIKSDLSDYPEEHIDFRIFKLNQEFESLKNEFDKLKKQTFPFFYQIFAREMLIWGPLGLPLSYLISRKKANEIKNRLSNLKKSTELAFEKMRSDNQKIANLSLALKNIANIYTDVNNRLIPTVEAILDDISVKYGNDYSKIPMDILILLRTTTKILKELAEKRIIPKSSLENIANSVITASNNLSVEYENIKQAFSEAA